MNKNIKNRFLNNYKSYSVMLDSKKLKAGLNSVADYLTSNIEGELEYKSELLDKVLTGSYTAEKKKASINNTIIELTNNALELCFKSQALLDKFNSLSNNKARAIILKAIKLATTIDYIFNRQASVYNIQAKCYTQKVYTKSYKLSLSQYLYSIAVLLGDSKLTI